MRLRPVWAALVPALAMLACGYQVPAESPPPSSNDPLSFGSDVYEQNCQGCHGDKGQGTEGRPALVGHGALPVEPAATAKQRKAKFEKGSDLAAFIQSDMPPLAPGSLSEKETLAVTLYLLRENGAQIASVDQSHLAMAIPRK